MQLMMADKKWTVNDRRWRMDGSWNMEDGAPRLMMKDWRCTMEDGKAEMENKGQMRMEDERWDGGIMECGK